jgi:hypothetical protein
VSLSEARRLLRGIERLVGPKPSHRFTIVCTHAEDPGRITFAPDDRPDWVGRNVEEVRRENPGFTVQVLVGIDADITLGRRRGPPHTPRGKLWWGEDGRLHWESHPDEAGACTCTGH